MTLDLIRTLAKEGSTFSFNQALLKTGIKRDILKVILSRLEKRGFIERIEKGKYLIIPLDSEQGKYTLHEFVMGSWIIQPYAIGYWSALHYYGFTEQIPRTVFIQTPARKKKSIIEIFGINYQVVRIKEEKFFGLRKEWIEETAVYITDKEKTIVDCLDKPQYAGGIIEVAKALNDTSLDLPLLVSHAHRIGSTTVIRRLGFLCDKMMIPINLQPPKIRKYHLLDPTMPPEGRLDSKWRLIVNIREDFDENS